jgi:hypothetical protein
MTVHARLIEPTNGQDFILVWTNYELSVVRHTKVHSAIANFAFACVLNAGFRFDISKQNVTLANARLTTTSIQESNTPTTSLEINKFCFSCEEFLALLFSQYRRIQNEFQAMLKRASAIVNE